ncbi:hypothetical protein OESDEN_15627 [Oesophagostomum dentatum]|uniref:ABC transmembrane type-1 domain-containing protein n=1 Tax=Oesophagostomum dentatum TaxID=61180 RepID=A0A0B1SME2_OESDE|nr:hypothetical protein OESDEN_15627 [Oesophagostomum dentatum]
MTINANSNIKKLDAEEEENYENGVDPMTKVEKKDNKKQKAIVQFLCFSTVCCRIIAKIRHHYVKAVLRQNAGWMDKHHSGVLTTQLNDNIERIREGVGDKLGLLIRGFAMFFAALVLSFVTQWKLALFMFPVAPFSCICMGVMSRVSSNSH